MSELKKVMLNKSGFFGEFGGRFLPEFLTPIFEELEDEFYRAIEDPAFTDELVHLYKTFTGRPTPLTFCKNLSESLGGAQIYLKNEGVNLTGAHKINHCVGQALLAKRLGKRRIVAETGAGQHGYATATVCAKLGLECVIYMGYKDYLRQRPNVFFMETLGAKVIPVHSGGQTLRDAINEAMRDLISDPVNTHYLLGTVCGPHPYPVMNTYFQSVISREIKEVMTPDHVVACLGGGSNAMGAFFEFLDDEVELIAVEAGGRSLQETDFKCEHAARFESGKVGVAQGYKSMFLQNDDGQLKETHSISAGLDYSGVGPQIAYLHQIKRIKVVNARDEAVLDSLQTLAKSEGILAALESLHAVSYAVELAPQLSKDKKIVVNCSGSGTKDLFITAMQLDSNNFTDYLKQQINEY